MNTTNSASKPILTEEDKAKIREISQRIKVTKVVCTRSVKGKNGDSYAGFSAAWDSIQEDGGQNLLHTGDSEESSAVKGMTVKEARLASLILAMQADLAAHDHAMAGGNITQETWVQATKSIKHNYTLLMADTLHAGGNGNGASKDNGGE